MKSILVTGGTGFIGSHTSLLLLEKGYSLIILDSLINSSKNVIDRILTILESKKVNFNERIKFVKGDIKNKLDIEEAFDLGNSLDQKIEAVIHFAGLKSVSDSVFNPITYWQNNVIGTINLLEIMQKNNCKTFVFSSSATVYKSRSDKLLDEQDICAPVNPYGNTKLTIERILLDLQKSQPLEWKIACLRYFNPVGAHKSGLIGEDPLKKANNIFPNITQVAIGKLNGIKIFGSDWPTPDGTGIRDYIHVMDLAEGHLSALNYLTKQKPQILTLNLGTGVGTSVLGIIKKFEEVNKVSIPFHFEERRKGDNAFVVSDNSLAKSILCWIPTRDIEDICKDGWNWQIKNPNGY